MRVINEEGKKLVKSFEGKYNIAYKCPAGVWTIGYGHTSGVHEGMTISDNEIENLFNADMRNVSAAVDRIVPMSLNENQFSALVSFAFNCGVGALKGSTALKRINGGDIKGGANALLWWCKATVDGKKKVLEGLVRRRKAERELFLTEVVNQQNNDEYREVLLDVSERLDSMAVWIDKTKKYIHSKL